MRSYMIGQLVRIISECVPSELAQKTIYEAIKRDMLRIAKEEGEAGVHRYLADELRLWKIQLEDYRKKQRRDLIDRRIGTTINLLTALIAFVPTATDLLVHFGYVVL